MRVALTMALVLWGLASACSDGKDYPSIQVTSIAFGDEGMIPIRHTCEGEGLSPPLKISDVPDDTVGIALIMVNKDDDTPAVAHWLVWGTKESMEFLPEGVETVEQPFEGGFQGDIPDAGLGYDPPCDDEGEERRYVFKAYALDRIPALEPGATQAALEGNIDGHIVGYGKLVGYFKGDL